MLTRGQIAAALDGLTVTKFLPGAVLEDLITHIQEVDAAAYNEGVADESRQNYDGQKAALDLPENTSDLMT